MVITDRYDHSLDDKNRLAIPSQVRNALTPEVDGICFYVVPKNRYLELVPEKLFISSSAQFQSGLEVDEQLAKKKRRIFASATRVEIDKAGRVCIPDRYIAGSKTQGDLPKVSLGKDVALVGVGDRLELWNRSEYDIHYAEIMAG